MTICDRGSVDGNHHQQGALAATARAEEADEFALLDGECCGGHSLERSRPLAEDLAYALAADLRLHARGAYVLPRSFMYFCVPERTSAHSAGVKVTFPSALL